MHINGSNPAAVHMFFSYDTNVRHAGIMEKYWLKNPGIEDHFQ